MNKEVLKEKGIILLKEGVKNTSKSGSYMIIKDDTESIKALLKSDFANDGKFKIFTFHEDIDVDKFYTNLGLTFLQENVDKVTLEIFNNASKDKQKDFIERILEDIVPELSSAYTNDEDKDFDYGIDNFELEPYQLDNQKLKNLIEEYFQ